MKPVLFSGDSNTRVFVMHMVVLQTGSSAAFCSSLLFTWTNQLSDGRFDNHGDKGELVSGSILRIDVFPRNCIESNTAISRKKWQFVEIKETKLKYRLNFLLFSLSWYLFSRYSFFVYSFPERGAKCNLIGSMFVSAGSTGLQGKQR